MKNLLAKLFKKYTGPLTKNVEQDIIEEKYETVDLSNPDGVDRKKIFIPCHHNNNGVTHVREVDGRICYIKLDGVVNGKDLRIFANYEPGKSSSSTVLFNESLTIGAYVTKDEDTESTFHKVVVKYNDIVNLLRSDAMDGGLGVIVDKLFEEDGSIILVMNTIIKEV